ncbi:signal peptidase II [Candidatus Latescibacterota bacterium]
MRKYLWLVVIFIVAVAADQLTKIAVDNSFELYETRSLFGSYFQLTYIRNAGAAFGISVGGPTIMFAATLLVTIILAYLFFKGMLRPEHALGKAAVILVFAGAIGNIIDRIRLGEVIDFIDMGVGLRRWPVYNFADIYVTIGMIVLFLTYAVSTEESKETSAELSD